MLGSASVISTGSGCRGRGNCALMATGCLPSAGRGTEGSPRRFRIHPHRATAIAAMQVPPATASRSGGALLGRLLLRLLEAADLGEGLRAGDVGDRPVRA